MSAPEPRFAVTPVLFEYEALEPLYLEAGKATNILRGSLGMALRKLSCAPECTDSQTCTAATPCFYRQIFEGETGGPRPSGYQEAPRPFVLRWDDWREMRIPAGGRFQTGLHVFDGRAEVLTLLLRAYTKLPATGLGPGRAKLRLRAIRQMDASGAGMALWTPETQGPMTRPRTLRLALGPVDDAPRRVKVRFLSPTEVKQGGEILRDAAFRPLFLRLRERLTFLMTHYGADGGTADGAPVLEALRGAADAEIGAADGVRLVRQSLTPMDVQRFSTRTGQTHPLSGLMGEAEYEGDFRLLWAWLKAAEWSGVGRQTVWGKGAMRWEACG